MNNRLAIVADVGGTHIRFSLADTAHETPLLSESIRTLRVTEHPSLVAAAQHYFSDIGVASSSVGNGVLAVAGRVEKDRATITNHPWAICKQETQLALGLASLQLVNDFTAQAFAATVMTEADSIHLHGERLHDARHLAGTFAVLGPGTGLGVSALLVENGVARVLETEGGHMAFAASTSEEFEIQRMLRAEFGTVSNERLLSGGGLCNIHRCLSRMDGEAMPAALRPEDITTRARSGDVMCQRTVALFGSVFGAVTGDQILALGAWGGVFLTGGLVPKLLTEIQASDFRARLLDKGRFRNHVEQVPVLAVIHPQPGLLGAAALAARSCRH